MHEFLREILAATQCVEPQLRYKAERAIEDYFKHQREAIGSILSFVTDSNETVSLRHLAILLLNQNITKSWSEFQLCTKDMIIAFAFRWITSFVSDISSMSAFHKSVTILLAKVYDASSSVEREQIAAALAFELQSDRLPVIVYTLLCFCEISKESEYCKLVSVLQHNFSFIQGLIHSADVSNMIHCRALLYAFKFMRICIQKFGEARIACGYDDEAANVIDEYIPLWSSVTSQWLHKHMSESHSILSRLPILIECIKSLTTIIDCFSHICRLDPGSLNVMCWAFLQEVKDPCMHSKSSSNSAYSSDGDREDLEILVVQVFDLFCSNFSAEGTVSNGKSEQSQHFDGLFALLADYVTLTYEQIHSWSNTSFEFLCAEQDSSAGNSLRHAGVDLINEICRKNRGTAFVSLLTLVQQSFIRLKLLDASSGEYSKHLLRLEGLLWMLGGISKRYFAAIRASKDAAQENHRMHVSRSANIVRLAPPLQVLELLTFIVSTVFSLPRIGLVFLLQSRAIWLCGEMYFMFEQKSHSSELTMLCVSLLAAESPLTLRFQSCATLGKLIFKAKSLENIQKDDKLLLSAIEFCSQLALCADENTVNIPIETATYIICAEFELPTEAVHASLSCFLQIWFRYLSDSIIVEATAKLLTKILHKYPRDCAPILEKMYFPFLHRVLLDSKSNPNNGFVEVMIKFLSEVVRTLFAPSDAGIRIHVLQILVTIANEASYKFVFSESVQAIYAVLSHDRDRALSNAEHTDLKIALVNIALKGLSSIIANISNDQFSSDDRGIDPLVGLCCHTLLYFDEVVPFDLCCALVARANTCLEMHRSICTRSVLVMGLIHLFARKPRYISSLLLSPDTGMVKSEHDSLLGVCFLNTWFSLHGNLSSRYNNIISTYALLECVSVLYSVNKTKMALQFLELLLSNLPMLSGSVEEDIGQEDKLNMGLDNNEYDSHSESFENDDSDDASNDDDDDEWEDDESSLNGSKADNDSASYQTEEVTYLSDMLDCKAKKNTRNDIFKDISDNLVFSHALQTDPLILSCPGVSHDSFQSTRYTRTIRHLQMKTAALLGQLRLPQSGQFPEWLLGLSAKSLQYAYFLVENSISRS